MKKDLFELTIEEFTRLLLDCEKTYSINMKTFKVDGGVNDDEVLGTYSQLHDVAMELLASNPDNYIAKDIKKMVENDLFDYCIQLEYVDIYNYLQYKTDNFDAIKISLVLKDMKYTLNEIKYEKDYYNTNNYEQYQIAITILEQNKEGIHTNDNSQENKIVNKRGRPTRDITSKMIEDEDGRKLNKIRSLIKGKYGKDATLIILAAIKKGWMYEPTFKQVKDEFGNIGSRQGFKNYLDERKYTKEELKIVIERLECD